MVKSYEKSVKSLDESKDFEIRTPFWGVGDPLVCVGDCL